MYSGIWSMLYFFLDCYAKNIHKHITHFGSWNHFSQWLSELCLFKDCLFGLICWNAITVCIRMVVWTQEVFFFFDHNNLLLKRLTNMTFSHHHKIFSVPCEYKKSLYKHLTKHRLVPFNLLEPEGPNLKS